MNITEARPRRTNIDAQQWERVKSIVADALKQESSGAQAALAMKRCAGDPDLLHEVTSLLSAARAEPTDALEECAEHAASTLWRDDLSRSGERFGAYVAIRELGSGGMGSVYLAERVDGQFEKQVAIKVLKRGTDTNEVLQRFANERRILARLDHSNIARLLDAGTTDDGLPYFVMDLITGTPVTQFVRDEQLSVEARLQLFLKICAAVEIAHKAGVIHRDLKPTNILVNSDGEPKLLDFGIAKLLEPGTADVTATGRQHLTLSSASPEQVRGEAVSETTDVYALGVLLYEMLTEVTPYRFGSAPRSEVARRICEEEPPSPSVAAAGPDLQRRLRGNLDNIICFALRKEPARRYASVTEFADDIRRHLRGDVVRAGPTSLTYRIGRFVMRNQLLTVRSLAVAVTLLAAGGGTAALFLAGPNLRSSSRALGDAGSSTDLVDEKSIAVLPFQNLSTAPENAFFASGVQDAILTDLAKIADLKVINRTSVQHYASEAPRDLQEISEQLRVAYVLEGSVQRLNNQVRVTAKLTDARTNAQLWAQQYDRQLADVFAIQSEIAQKIASQLRVKLSSAERAAVRTEATRDMMAYDLYLRAQERDRGLTRAVYEVDEQVRLLDEAVARDPHFVPALCLLARIHVRSYFLNIDPSPARLELASKAVAAATEIAPDSGEVHLAQATLFYWGFRDYPRALDRLALARRSLPNDANIPLITGLIKRRQGKWEESIKHLREAASLDPRNATVLFELATTYSALKRYQDAAEVFERLLVWNKGEFVFEYARAKVDLKWMADTGRLRRVLASDASKDASPELLQAARLSLALLERDYDAAERALSVYWQPDVRTPDYVIPRSYFEAVIAQGHGDVEKAQDAFHKAREAAAQMADGNSKDGKALMILAQIDARLGHADTARRNGEQAVRLLSVTDDALAGAEMLVQLAKVYVWIGDTARALELIEQAAKLPYGANYGSLKLDEDWDSLRGNEQFEAIVASLAPK